MRRLWSALLALMLLGVAGCAKPEKTEAPVPGGTVRIGLSRSLPVSLRPLTGEGPASPVVTQMLYSGLLRPGPKLELLCDLCTEYAVSADGRTLTFRLRADVRWHDGQPFTAGDVASTYLAVLEPGYAGPHAGALAALAGVQALLDGRDAVDRAFARGQVGAEEALAQKAAAWQQWLDGPGKQAVAVADSQTISFTTDQPYAPVLTAMLLPILPAHTQAPVGTGPFKVAEFTEGQALQLVRHDTYHLGRPYLDRVIFAAVPPGRALEMLRSGAVDYAPLSAAEAAVSAGEAVLQVVSWPGAGYQYLGVNQDRPPFADVRVRQALLFGINREALVAELLHGRGRVVNTHLLPGHWAGEGLTLDGYGFDPARAAELLTAAGWVAADGQGYRTKDGERLRFTLKVPKGNPVREASAERIVRDLKALGVQVDLQVLEFGQVVREVFGERQADAWLLGWDLGLEPDPGPVFSPENKWGSSSGWSSARSEELLRQGRQVLTPAERQPAIGAWLKLVNQELPYLFLYAEDEAAGVRPNLRGLAPDLRGALWNIWAWWLPPE